MFLGCPSSLHEEGRRKQTLSDIFHHNHRRIFVMRSSNDRTIQKNYLARIVHLVKEYELVKQKSHPSLKHAHDFYKHYGLKKQIFLKYYHRYQLNGSPESLLPQKRGPKWQTRRPAKHIEERVIAERKRGLNRYEIYQILKPELNKATPSPSGIYNICRRYGYQRITQKMKVNKRQIIKNKAGELGHIDCHYLPKNLLGDNKKYYLVCIIDSCTRIAWAEVVEDVKSLTVMFSALKILNLINAKYQIQFDEILSDNGPEFASKSNKEQHPFERMMIELGIVHRYTRPYRPQTNGKVERFWRTIEGDLVEGTDFNSLTHFKDELMQYLIYYNEYRPHQGIGGKTPKDIVDNLSAN
jgi:transposase InsO family protein